VVTGYENREVLFNDPSSGQAERLSRALFEAAWDAHGREGLVIIDIP
jgi:uncharacterized protein YvpB